MCATITRKAPSTPSSSPTTAEPTASTTKAPPAPPPVKLIEKPEVVSAARIIADFEKNEVTAEDRYGEKCFDVTGIVDQIDAGLGGDATLNLRGGFLGMVVSDIPRSFAKTLSKGDSVRLSVDGVDEILGNPVASFSEKCSQVSRAAAEQEKQMKAAAVAEKKAKLAQEAAAKKAKQAEAAVAKRTKSTTAVKSASKERVELPCRPGQQPPCY
jgi:hypothetical protein